MTRFKRTQLRPALFKNKARIFTAAAWGGGIENGCGWVDGVSWGKGELVWFLLTLLISFTVLELCLHLFIVLYIIVLIIMAGSIIYNDYNG